MSFRNPWPSLFTTGSSPRYTSDGQYATEVWPTSSPWRNADHIIYVTHTHNCDVDGFRPPTDYERHQKGNFSRTNTGKRRPRRNSTSAFHSTRATRKPQKGPTPKRQKATVADAQRCGIPTHYCLDEWDPTEEPIILLGSVFDAYSLGKWIYDWTAFYHGSSNAISEMAGELWLLLIQLYGKTKSAEESLPNIKSAEEKDMTLDFTEAGYRLKRRLRELFVLCEEPMLRTRKKHTPRLGRNAGIEFVKAVFGHAGEIEDTQIFMGSVRLWNLRFDANCGVTLVASKSSF